MELSFTNVSSLVKSAAVSFTPNSPMHQVLLQMNTANVSQNVDEIADALGLDWNDVETVLTQLYNAGMIYVEQQGHYTLSRYGKAVVQHVIEQPQTEVYDYSVPTTTTYNKVLALFKENPRIVKAELDGLKLTAPTRKALGDLIQRGYINAANPEYYELSSVARAHARYQEEMAKLSDEQLEEVYQYFKQAHPEYKYVYKFMDTHADNKKVLFNDVRKYIKGVVISESFSSQNVPTIENWWGGKNIPAHTSIEAAIGKEIQYMAQNIKHVGEAAPTMDDVKTARTYILVLSSKATPALVSSLFKQHPMGSTLPEAVIVDMAKQIVGKAFPSNLDVESIEDAISQVIQKNRDITLGRFLPTDMSANMAPVVGNFLRKGESGIEAFNNFITESNYSDEVLRLIFSTSKDFRGLDLKNVTLTGNITGVDFSGSDFSNAHLENTIFSQCQFQPLKGKNVRFTGASLEGTHFIECNLDQADFENAAGLGSSKTLFTKNIGKPLNFFAITGEKSNAEWERTVAEPQKVHLDMMLNEDEKDVAKVLSEQLRSFVYKTAALHRVLSKLSFVVTADRKQDILNLLNPKVPIADWITKDALVQMVKDGELARMGIDSKYNGKLIGMVSQREKEKEQARPKSRYEELAESYTPAQQQVSIFASQLAAFLESNKGQHLVSRDALVGVIPQSAVEIRGLIAGYGTQQHVDAKTGEPRYGLTPHDLEEISLQLSKAVHGVSNDASPKVTAEKTKLNNFAYTSRISPISKGDYSDRGNMHLDYPETFGMILEPSTFGVADPDVRKMIDALTVHAMWRKTEMHPASGHWKNAVATSRVQPHIVEQKDIASTKKNTKKVWVMVELQSDPYQKNMYTLGSVVSPEWKVPTNTAWKISDDRDDKGGMALNSEPHRMLNVLQELSKDVGDAKVGIDPNKLAEWGQKDSSTINFTLDELAAMWDVAGNTAIESSFKSIVKMFLKSGTVPAVLVLSETGQGETKKQYQRIPNGESVITVLLANRVITPVLVKNDESPLFVGADGKQFNKYQADSAALLAVIKTAMTTVLKDAIKQLRDAKLVTVSGTTGLIMLTDYGATTQHIYDKLGKFRQHYRDWPEMVILETINRALDMGIDEIWIPSASEYMKSPDTDRDLSAYYDTPAKKFTSQMISPPFNIEDEGSHLWTGVQDEYNPKQYYVIKLSDWKVSMKTSALRFTASVYTTFVRQYINKAKTAYPYLDTVPENLLVESAFAYMVEQGKVANEPQVIEGIRLDINTEFNTTIQGQPANYVKALVLGKVNLEKSLLATVLRAGEEPSKIANEIFTYLISRKYPEWSVDAKANIIGVFNSLVEKYPIEFIGDAQQAYDDMKTMGINPNTEGDVGQTVSPTGEPLPPEGEGMSNVDKLIQQQQQEQEGAAQKEETESVRFEPPNVREQHNLVEEEINRLLDELHRATTDEDKNRIRKRLHEMSTLAALRFNLFKFSVQQVQEKRTGRTGTIMSSTPSGEVVVKWNDGTQSKTTMFYLSKLNMMGLPESSTPPATTRPRVQEQMYISNNYPALQFASLKVSAGTAMDGSSPRNTGTINWKDRLKRMLKRRGEDESTDMNQPSVMPKKGAIQPPDEGAEVEFIKDYPYSILGKPVVVGMRGFVRDFEGGKVNIELIKPFGFIRNFATWVISLQMSEWHDYVRLVTSKQAMLTFAAVDQEFNRPKDVLKETPRNDFFQYEPAHGEVAPVGGGAKGDGGATDTSNMDMKGGFYTDLNLPDPHKKEKELVQFEPSNHVNLQPSFIASFDFTRFKTTVMSGLRATAEFGGMSDAAITERLYRDWLFAKENDLL